jgi:hypothetical protein
MDAILNYYDNHVNGVEDVHPASDIDFSATYTWANGSSGFYGAAVTVQDAIDGVVYDLASVSAPAGVARIGVAGATGTLTTPASTNPVTLLSGELKDAIDLLQIAVNGRVFRGGDDGITGTIAPNTDGVALGIASQRWDAYIQNLDVEIIACDLIPDGDDARVVGSGSARWQGEFTTINATDITAVTVEGSIIVPVTDDLTCNGPLYCDGVAAFTNQTSVDESVDSDAALTVLNAGTTDAIGIDVTASGSSSSIGIKATSTDGTANYCSSSAGTASYCSSSTGIALAAVAAGTSPAIQASNTSSGNGIVGSSTSGVGVAGTSFGLTTNKYIVQKIPMSAGCSEIDGSGGSYWKQTADAWFLLGATPGYYVAFSIPWHPYGGALLKVITWAHPNTGTITLNATRKMISLSNISSSDVAFTVESYPATSQSMLVAEPISGSAAGRIEHPVTVNNIVPRSEQTAVGGAYNSHDAYEVRLEYTADTTNAAIYGICLVWDMQSVSSFHGPILT